MSERDSSAVLKRARFIVGGIVSLLLIGAVAVLVLRSFHAGALEASTTLHAKQYVTTITPKAATAGLPAASRTSKRIVPDSPGRWLSS